MIRIFFHSSDLDGHCSGAIVKYKFTDAELHPINYGQDFPYDKVDIEKDTIIMVDFTLQPIEKTIELYEKFGDRFTLIDHHISAINDLNLHNLNDKIPGIRMNGMAGCELTWSHFFPDRELPKAIRLLGRYDVWDHKDPDVLPFQMGIRLHDTWPDEQSLWQYYFHENANELIKDTISEGNLILKYQKQENEKYAKSCAFEMTFEGYRAICINKMLTNSQLFESVYSPDEHDIMIAFGLRKNGLWTMSFYTTKEDVDCSLIAKRFGGGGHKQAAGATFKKLPLKFVDYIKYLQPITFEQIPDYGDKMTIQDFKEAVILGALVDSDGCGRYASENEMTDLVVQPSDYFKNTIDERFSHVIWFNK